MCFGQYSCIWCICHSQYYFEYYMDGIVLKNLVSVKFYKKNIIYAANVLSMLINC